MSRIDTTADQPIDLTRAQFRAAQHRAWRHGRAEGRAGRGTLRLSWFTIGASITLILVALATVAP